MRDSNELNGADPVDLAHAAPFRLGGVEVRPALRQLFRAADGAEEVIEPRIMQVLVALAQADGAVVTRDELVRCCWDGRIVGEDAINRAISRVRRLAEGIGRGSFRVETLTKVGYRLVATGAAADTADAAAARPSRRGLIAGGAAALAVAGAGGAWWALGGRSAPQPPSPQVAALIEQANASLGQRDAQGISQAIGLYREVTRIAPDYADGWGSLALAYAATAGGGARETAAANRARARAAVERTRALEPDNAFARMAVEVLRPRMGSWWLGEQAARRAIADRPDVPMAYPFLAQLYAQVGRFRDALPLWQEAERRGPPIPGNLYLHGQALWAANRLEEAEALLERGRALFPLHFAIWFTWAYFLLYTGRAAEALAFLEDRSGRPPGFEDQNFDVVTVVARALLSRAPGDVERAVRANLAAAHSGAGFAENAVQFLSVLGRPDEAFAVLDAYFFSRGWVVPEVRFTAQQASHTRLADRRTFMLFLPSTASLRGDPRFGRLLEAVGLERYWRESGSRPDFRS